MASEAKAEEKTETKELKAKKVSLIIKIVAVVYLIVFFGFEMDRHFAECDNLRNLCCYGNDNCNLW